MKTANSHRFLVSARCVGAFALLGLLFPLGACGEDQPNSAPAVVVGTPDRLDNGVISVVEADMTGVLEGGKLKVSIPVKNATGTDAAGSLSVRILDVEGDTTIGTTTVGYAVGASASTVLLCEVTAPSDVSTQSDLVKYNLRIDEGSLRITRSLLHVVPPYEVRLEGPATAAKNKKAVYRVTARNTRTLAGMPNVPVTLTVNKDAQLVLTYSATTTETGDALFPIAIADEGAYEVLSDSRQFGIHPEVKDALKVEGYGGKVLLTTDKPIYQPGQTIHVRALALGRDGNKPVAQAAVTFEVEDGKGNKVFKKQVTTEAHGIAWTDFRIGTLVNMGTFKVRTILGDAKTEKTVAVSQYALPKFDVAVKADKAWYRPGETVTGTLDSRYFFGKAVTGDVQIAAATLDVGQTAFQNVVGKLDAEGHFQFTVQLPRTLAGIPLQGGNAAVSLHVSVTDSAGQLVEKDQIVTVSEKGINVVLIPESTVLVPGLDNQMLLFVTDPLGAPVANATVSVTTPAGDAIVVTTDAFGQSKLTWQVPEAASASAFTAVVNAPDGTTASVPFSFATQDGKENLIVRTDKAVYEIGDTATIEVIAKDGTRSIYVDWLNAGQAVDMRTLKADQGKATFTMPIDTTLLGSNRIEAYVVGTDGNITRAGRTVFSRNGTALNVSMHADKLVYAPGDPAKLTFSVKDENGSPAVAALGVQIVDQAVFALVDAKPGLLRSFFELEDSYAKPTYELAAPGVDFNQMLFDRPTDPAAAAANQSLARATFAALGDHPVLGIAQGSWKAVETTAIQNLATPYLDAQKTLDPFVRDLVPAELAALAARGCTPDLYYCEASGDSFGHAAATGLAPLLVAYDFWGNAYKVTAGEWLSLNVHSLGPDETDGTGDDHDFSISFSDSARVAAHAWADAGVMFELPVNGAAGMAGMAGMGGSTGAGGLQSSSGDTPRVRKDFPETLYVNPALITGPDGVASIDVPIADSITQWRVSTLANASDGRLGGSESGFQVFQDFFVDINFPATLTRGDEVSFPLAVYNYLADPQMVTLSLVPGDWYTPLGATTASVSVQPGQVLGASFPVRVDKVGLRTLTVSAHGSVRSDAVQRVVNVVPDGKAITDTFSGLLAPGNVSHAFDFSAVAVSGANQLFVNVYPTFLAQVVKGMDSMLQEPTGCFEQTTSSTWPNVLVTAYMTKTNQLTPDVQMKAESLISTGYQRLLTFEHPGGGFSWFGTQDPAPFLSVTAFGVMEFADMARVANVDPAMLERTINWLVGQQASDGSFKGDQSEFFSFHTSSLRNTAFVLWALASAGYTGPALDKGAGFVKTTLSNETPDAYTLALVANALQLAAPDDSTTTKVFADLDRAKIVDGDKISWNTGGTQTCFYESGQDGAVTATALALHALLLRGGSPSIDGALKFITAAKDQQGNFGATQATVWSLRALLLAASKGTEGAVGTLAVDVDGTTAQTIALTQDQSDVMTTVDLGTLATAGTHDVALTFVGTGKVSYNAVGRYNLPWALMTEPPAGPLSIAIAYDKTSLYVNDTVRATATVHNDTASAQNMVLVTLGIPPGFEVVVDDLDGYVRDRTLSKYDMTGKQVVLYVSALAPAATLSLSYRLTATMPVKASDGGGEAHPYYEPQKRVYSSAQVLNVAER